MECYWQNTENWDNRNISKMQKKIETHYIKKLIEQGEHQQLDFKYEISDSKKIARSLVAFANTDGGRLLVGVKDNGAIVGVHSDEEFYMVEGASKMYSRPEVSFAVKKWIVDGKTILEIIVNKSNNRPHSAPDKDGKWLAYIRVVDQNLLANRVLLQVWNHQKRNIAVAIQYTEPERCLLSYLNENKTITISKFCKIAKINRRVAEKKLVGFIVLNIIKIVFTEKQTYYELILSNDSDSELEIYPINKL